MSDSDAEGVDLNGKDKGENALAEEVMERCIRIVANVNNSSSRASNRIALYRDLYAGKVKRKNTASPSMLFCRPSPARWKPSPQV